MSETDIEAREVKGPGAAGYEGSAGGFGRETEEKLDPKWEQRAPEKRISEVSCAY
jgi:hypothetical protein